MLTDDEINAVCDIDTDYTSMLRFGRAVEAAVLAKQAAIAQKEVTMDDAVAAGDGCLHSTIDNLQDEVARQKVCILSLCEQVQHLVAEKIAMQDRLRVYQGQKEAHPDEFDCPLCFDGWKKEAQQEPIGTVVEYREHMYQFYPWGQSPYLDNAVNHWVVYTQPSTAVLRQALEVIEDADIGNDEPYESWLARRDAAIAALHKHLGETK